MPSVHVAWAVLVSWAVITSGLSRWRWLILLHPAVTVFVVVGTGNHFWADGIVAAAVVAAVLAALAFAGACIDRYPWGRMRRQQTPGTDVPYPDTTSDTGS
jgi:hypothetical protein